MQNNPIASFHSSCITRTLLLLLHTHIETVDVGTQIIFFQYKFGQVERETVCVIQHKGFVSTDAIFPGGTGISHHLVEQANTGREGTEERLLFFLDHFLDKHLLSGEFGICIAHRFDKRRQQFVDKRLLQPEECITVTYGTAQNTAYHITGLGIRRQLPIGNRKRNRTHMVGNHPHGNIAAGIIAISLFCKASDGLNQRLENIGIIIRRFPLQRHTKTLETHTRIYDLCRQRFECTVGLTIVLHKDKVPNLYNLRVALVHQRKTVDSRTLGLATQVDVHFRTRTARSRIAHFPEIIMSVTVDDMVCRQMFFPIRCGFIVAFETFGRIPLENRCIKTFRVDFQNIDQIFPRPIDSLLLEIITERPVSQHLEHRMMIRVQSNLFEVIVLAAHPQAFLRIGYPFIFCRDISQYNVFELVHSRIGKHQRGIVLNDHRCRRHDLMVFRCKKVLERLSNFFSCKHIV